MKHQETRQEQAKPDNEEITIKQKYSIPDGQGVYADAEIRTDCFDCLIPPLKKGGELEAFANMLVELRDALYEEPGGADRVFNELGYMLESVFRQSQAYRMAYTIYAGRFAIIGCETPLSLFTNVIAQTIPSIIVRPEEPTEEPVNTEPEKMVYRLCDYHKLDLDFSFSEEGNTVYSFQLARNHRDSDEIFFNTFGERDTSLNRNGYKFPLGKDATDFAESLILTGSRGKILFLGYKDTPVFALSYTNTGGEFEGHFIIYGANGESIQALALFEEGVNHD